jgi:YfiH family protein
MPYFTVDNGVTIWRDNALATQGKVMHFVSTRMGGVSQAPCASLNLSFRVGDPADAVRTNRRRLTDGLGIPLDSLVAAQQVHGSHTEVVTGAAKGRGATDFESALPGTDALITDEPGVCLLIMAADCVPILLYEPHHGVIGAVHAGWRGTVAGMAARVVAAMNDTYGCDPASMLALVGPSIGPEDYEVGDEVADDARAAFPQSVERVIRRGIGEKPHFDLWAANVLQLEAAGVRSSHIAVAGISTFTTPERFFSERRDHFPTGRFAAGIMLQG